MIFGCVCVCLWLFLWGVWFLVVMFGCGFCLCFCRWLCLCLSFSCVRSCFLGGVFCGCVIVVMLCLVVYLGLF